MKITLNENQTYQRFEGFGASGAWWAQIVGGWSEPFADGSSLSKRDRISQLLYDKNVGIGLRTYRYNIGGGSAESGKGVYWDGARRAECFLANGKLDFTKDANAVYMMKQAVSDGAEEIILFVNSPPETMTKNGMAQLGKFQIMRTNLDKKNYSAFADYCLAVTGHFIKQGLPIKYLSPVNEPLWLWNGGQEGCHYSPRQAGRIMLSFAEKIAANSELAGLKLSGVENGDIRWFNKSYTRQMLRYPQVKNLVDSVDVHSYFTHLPLPSFVNNRQAFLKRYERWMKKHYPDVPVKMSEWTHMQGGRDPGMKSALVTAKTIFDDITLLSVTSWQHWLACSQYDYCDGLIYLDLEKREFSLTKRYFVTGNFSKFIPYGALRFDVKTDSKGIDTLGFIKDGVKVIILINSSGNEENFTAPSKGKTALTDEIHDLTENEILKGQTVTVPAQSVITYIYGGEDNE